MKGLMRELILTPLVLEIKNIDKNKLFLVLWPYFNPDCSLMSGVVKCVPQFANDGKVI